MKLARPLISLILFFASCEAYAEKITVAVASNFSAAAREIATEFEQASGHQVQLAFGSSGKLYAQIIHGAPFAAFFSADQEKPAALEREGLTVPGQRFTYALGSLALWSASSQLAEAPLARLKHGRFNKLAIANPKLAPYGRAATEVLRNLDLEHKTKSKWILGENITQTYQFVGTANADLGFVALSQIHHQGQLKSGSAWIVPASLYTPIQQQAVLLQKGENSNAAQALLAFVRGEKAKTIIERFGYTVPSTQPSAQPSTHPVTDN